MKHQQQKIKQTAYTVAIILFLVLILYERGKNNAREKGIKQAKEDFNLCPICKHIVCNNCFLICEDLDMCASCAKRLDEKGEPVATTATEKVQQNKEENL